MLVNAPATGARPLGAEEVEACEAAAMDLMRRLRPDARHELGAARTTPADFAQRFPATGGALYGAASHGWRASFARPGARSRLPGLYLAGGSVHPGPGVPMAALSGRQAALAVIGGPGFDAAVRPGGYAWWYVDAFSDDGRFGLTIIAFVGSVFSPYYAWRGRRDPLDHCAINVALYGRDASAGR